MPAHRQIAATVLVVEDDAMINLTTVDTIREQGYFVLSAADADEALLVLAAHPEVNVLFTDIKMPGSIDGLALAGLTRRDYPLIEIVIASGTLCPSRDEMPARATFLPKPYSVKQIAETLGALMTQTIRLAS